MPKANKVVALKWVSKQELRKVLDARARRVLGMSGSSFQKQYACGTLGPRSLDGKAGTVELATLCFFTRGKRSAHQNRKRSR
jgi:hypothetical protein